MTDQMTFETEAMLLRALPITPLGIDGVLRLGGGRLRFAGRNGDVRFDVPVRDVRDVGTWGKYVLRVDLPDRRVKIAIGDRQRVLGFDGLGALGLALQAAQVPGALSRDAANRGLVSRWVEVLRAAGAGAAAGASADGR